MEYILLYNFDFQSQVDHVIFLKKLKKDGKKRGKLKLKAN